jgi:hypothetical protein
MGVAIACGAGSMTILTAETLAPRRRKHRDQLVQQFGVVTIVEAGSVLRDCIDPPTPQESIAAWLMRMKLHEAHIPRDQLQRIPTEYVKPYPTAGRVRAR